MGHGRIPLRRGTRASYPRNSIYGNLSIFTEIPGGVFAPANLVRETLFEVWNSPPLRLIAHPPGPLSMLSRNAPARKLSNRRGRRALRASVAKIASRAICANTSNCGGDYSESNRGGRDCCSRREDCSPVVTGPCACQRPPRLFIFDYEPTQAQGQTYMRGAVPWSRFRPMREEPRHLPTPLPPLVRGARKSKAPSARRGHIAF